MNPDYVVLIVVDEPGGASYYGSIAATPYAKTIIEKIIDYKKYEPTTDVLEDEKKINQKVNMPSLVGLEIYEAISILENLGLQVEVQGEGGIVYSQFPYPQEEVIVNGIVMLDTNN